MLSKIISASTIGIESFLVEVEIDISGGIPCFQVVGLPDATIRESRNRIISAIKNTGIKFPNKKITVNLAPADIKKEGVNFDLPIAIGILTAANYIKKEKIKDFIICGQLSLNGEIKPIKGALPIALNKYSKKSLILPSDNAKEVEIVKSRKLYSINHLREAINFFNETGSLKIINKQNSSMEVSAAPDAADFHDVKGQEFVKRGLEVAACGMHNALLIGPPGSGKSMLAKRMPSIMTDMTFEEALETTKILSVAKKVDPRKGIVSKRPFRSPHHTISDAALVGGGNSPMPGEISLSHNGVLFLDELPEFKRNVLEVLRQPLEDGKVTISRVERSLTFPARFMLITAMNPCPCGYFTDNKKECHCSPNQIQKYLSKISGPLLDRIDIHLEVPRLKYETLSSSRKGEKSKTIKERVVKTQSIQKKRYKDSNILFNAHLESRALEEYCILTDEAKELLKTAIFELGISARAYDKILKIARTISDMESKEIIDSYHVSEAIGYRSLDRNIWA